MPPCTRPGGCATGSGVVVRSGLGQKSSVGLDAGGVGENGPGRPPLNMPNIPTTSATTITPAARPSHTTPLRRGASGWAGVGCDWVTG